MRLEATDFLELEKAYTDFFAAHRQTLRAVGVEFEFVLRGAAEFIYSRGVQERSWPRALTQAEAQVFLHHPATVIDFSDRERHLHFKGFHLGDVS